MRKKISGKHQLSSNISQRISGQKIRLEIKYSRTEIKNFLVSGREEGNGCTKCSSCYLKLGEPAFSENSLFCWKLNQLYPLALNQ